MKAGPDMTNFHFFTAFFFAGAALLVASMFVYWILFKTENATSQTYRKVQILFGLIVLAVHGVVTRGGWPILTFMAVCAAVGMVVEAFGVKKGWIFGNYRYTNRMGPRLFGSLPVVIPLLWIVICYLGGSMADLLVSGTSFPDQAVPSVRALAAAGIITLFDAVIDPIAVAEKRWVWERPGAYHGIPASNFIGWFGTVLLIFLLLNRSFYSIPARPGIPGWMLHLPAFGYCLFLAFGANVCMERNLKRAGAIGWIASILLAAAGLAALLT
jgi:uncharacterized membrane protein